MPVLNPLSGAPLLRGAHAPAAAGSIFQRVRALGEARSPVFLGLMVAALAFLADQQTKHIAINRLIPTRPIDAPGPFRWHLTYNEGGAFGTSVPGGRWFFLVVTVVVVVIVVRNLPTVGHAGQAIAYGLLLSGALGNASDRVFRADHRVVDFIQLPNWPIFNVADVAITAGFVLLLLLLWVQDRAEQRAENAAAATLGSVPSVDR